MFRFSLALAAAAAACWFVAPLLPAPLALIAAVACVTILPGYALVGALFDRPRASAAHATIAALAGLASYAIAAMWWTRVLPWSGATTLLAALTPIAAGAALRWRWRPATELPPLATGARGNLVLAALIIAATALASAPYVEHGRATPSGGLHWFYMGHDWFKHLQVYRALADEATIPPQNPFVATQQTFRYYLGFYIPAAAAAKITRPDTLLAHQWTLFAYALAIPAIVAILLAHLARALGAPPRAALLAAALGGVLGMGLDALPALAQHALLHRGDGALFSIGAFLDKTPDINWWIARRQEHALASFMWVPQHAAAMASILGLLLLLWSPGAAPRVTRRIVMGMLAAAAVFQSVYVGTSAAVFLAAIAARSALDRDRAGDGHARAIDLAWAGAFAAVFALPVLAYYASASGGYSGYTLALPPAINPREGGIFSKLVPGAAGRLLDTPLSYALEFGPHILLGGAFLLATRGRATAAWRALAWSAGVGLLFVTFVVPHGYNNIYSRGGTLLALLLAVPAGAWIDGAFATPARAAKAIALRVIAARAGVVILCGASLLSSVLLAAGMWRFTHTHAIDAPAAAALAWIRDASPRDTRLLFTQDPLAFPHKLGYFAQRSFLASDDLHEKLFIADTTEVARLHTSIDAALAAITEGRFDRSMFPAWPIAFLAGAAPEAIPQAALLPGIATGAQAAGGLAGERVVFLSARESPQHPR
ncbi:MAG: hypothetical protein ACKVU1_08010 [bacterium]